MLELNLKKLKMGKRISLNFKCRDCKKPLVFKFTRTSENLKKSIDEILKNTDIRYGRCKKCQNKWNSYVKSIKPKCDHCEKETSNNPPYQISIKSGFGYIFCSKTCLEKFVENNKRKKYPPMKNFTK